MDCLGRAQQACGGALINRNLGASGALEIAHTPRVPAVIRVESGEGRLRPVLLDCNMMISSFVCYTARGGAGVVNDFDKWLPFFNVTFCGHATQQSGRWERVALRWFH